MARLADGLLFLLLAVHVLAAAGIVLLGVGGGGLISVVAVFVAVLVAGFAAAVFGARRDRPRALAAAAAGVLSLLLMTIWLAWDFEHTLCELDDCRDDPASPWLLGVAALSALAGAALVTTARRRPSP